MNDRRAFVQIALALGGAGLGHGNLARALASQSLTQQDLLSFKALGQVTLLHLTDVHAQLVPVYYREPAINIGAGDACGQLPHITGRAFLERFGLQAGDALTHSASLLYRRGNLNGTFDDVICQALQQSQNAETALSPGCRWGSCVLPGQAITREDIYNQTAITYPAVTRNTLTGAQLKAILEDVADKLFNPDPYYQQGGDMVRVAGLGFELKTLVRIISSTPRMFLCGCSKARFAGNSGLLPRIATQRQPQRGSRM